MAGSLRQLVQDREHVAVIDKDIQREEMVLAQQRQLFGENPQVLVAIGRFALTYYLYTVF